MPQVTESSTNHRKVYNSNGVTSPMNIVVREDLCSGCGLCAANCPQGVYEVKDNKSRVVNRESCLECHLCEVICEKGAITIEEP